MTIQAIVLTHDRQISLAELTYKAYMQLWPDCPLRFRIPRNDVDAPGFDFLAQQANAQLISCPRDIRSMMSALRDGIAAAIPRLSRCRSYVNSRNLSAPMLRLDTTR